MAHVKRSNLHSSFSLFNILDAEIIQLLQAYGNLTFKVVLLFGRVLVNLYRYEKISQAINDRMKMSFHINGTS